MQHMELSQCLPWPSQVESCPMVMTSPKLHVRRSASHLAAAPLGPSAARLMAGAPPRQAAAPRSLVPIMTTSTLGTCRRYSCPFSRRHCRCAAWSPAPLHVFYIL